MQTSVISKFLSQSKSFQDEQADEWLKLKVDKNKIDNLLKIIHRKIPVVCIIQTKIKRLHRTFCTHMTVENIFEVYYFLFQILHCIILT